MSDGLKYPISYGLTTSEAEVLFQTWGRNELKALNVHSSTGEPVKTTVKRDGSWQNIDSSLVVPGDLVMLAQGCIATADIMVNEGEIEVDQPEETGGWRPAKLGRGEVCKAGSRVTNCNYCEGTVVATGRSGEFVSNREGEASDGSSEDEQSDFPAVPLKATVKRDGRWQNIDSNLVASGELALLVTGCIAAVDIMINSGEIEVDQPTETGERQNAKLGPGQVCRKGSRVTRGDYCEGTVVATGQTTD